MIQSGSTEILGTLDAEQKQDLKTYVLPLVQAYNATRHDTTSLSHVWMVPSFAHCSLTHIWALRIPTNG